ncbi:hypothetical protein C8R46DRAFT_1235511 [Mycena filopes]|nr:hypothetical protein C8R46DRAFT_1235511 [Mycena filopes]
MTVLPQELVDEIIAHLRGDLPALAACTRTHSSFYPTSHKLMFSRLKLGPRSKDLSVDQAEQLLSNFPDVVQHVHELFLRPEPGGISGVQWPRLPPLPALRRICISNAWSTDGRDFTSALLSTPSLAHFHVYSVMDLELPSMLAALPQTLKSGILGLDGGRSRFAGFRHPYPLGILDD